MYIETIPNRSSPPAILLRESCREGQKIRKRTLANLTKWPTRLVEGLRTLLRGGTAVDDVEEAFEVLRTRPHGHVAAVLGTLRQIALESLVEPRRCPQRDRVVAMVCARILNPGSKLATVRGLNDATRCSSLGELLEVQAIDKDALYAAMDWLLERQPRIEAELAKRHLTDGTLVLYDLTSTYFEGRTCPLAKAGYSRDGKKGRLQIVFGLLCDPRGCPVAVEVFDGNTGDPSTVGAQIQKLRQRFGLTRVVLVGDRGMITSARIREEFRDEDGIDWITALRGPAISKLLEQKTLQLSLFDHRPLAEILSPDCPGERLIACKNPVLAKDRARTREELLKATEIDLDKLRKATERPKRALRGKDRIALRLGKVLNRHKVGKHFLTEVTEERFTYWRDHQRIAEEAVLDGIHIVRTSVPQSVLDDLGTVAAYKSLSRVERAFRSLESVDLKVRPIHHRLPERVRAHVFLCMLAYCVEWHMRQALAPMLFDDDDPVAAEAQRSSPVVPAKPSPRARHKANRKHTEEDLPVHGFQTLLDDLATIAKNRIRIQLPDQESNDEGVIERTTRTTPLQQRALSLLGVRL